MHFGLEDLVLLLFLILPIMFGGILIAAFRVYQLHRRRGIIRLMLGNLLVFLFLCSLFVLTGEIYYRFFCDTTDSFSMSKMSTRWFDRHQQRNQTGFRDTIEYEWQPKAGRRRISFLGDSFTTGDGVKNVEDRFVNRVRNMLHGDEVEIHCLAVGGLDTGIHLELIQKLIDGNYKLDVVVLVSVLNDVGDIVPEKLAMDKGFDARFKPSFLARNSFFINSIYFNWMIGRDPDFRDYDHLVIRGYEGRIWDDHCLRLEKLQSAIESQGGQLVVVTFPYVHALGPNNQFVRAHQRLADFWEEQGVPHLDLLASFESCDPQQLVVGRQDAHPNERAHAIAADAIAEFLIKHQIIKKSSFHSFSG